MIHATQYDSTNYDNDDKNVVTVSLSFKHHTKNTENSTKRKLLSVM